MTPMTAAASASPEQERTQDGEHGDEVDAGLTVQEVADDGDGQPDADEERGDGPAPRRDDLVAGEREGQAEEQATEGERQQESRRDGVEPVDHSSQALLLVVPPDRRRSTETIEHGPLHARAAWTLSCVLGGRWRAIAGLRGRRRLRSGSEGGADGLTDEVRDERGDATECELSQAATDGRALGEEAHAEAEQEEGGE